MLFVCFDKLLFRSLSLSLSDNDVDGESVECGLTDSMVSYLFPGSFKKQAKFNRFIREQKEMVTLTLEPFPEELCLQPFIEEG